MNCKVHALLLLQYLFCVYGTDAYCLSKFYAASLTFRAKGTCHDGSTVKFRPTTLLAVGRLKHAMRNNANLVRARLSSWTCMPSNGGDVRRVWSIGPAIKHALEAVVVLMVFGSIMVGIIALDLAIWTPVFHR
jgi:hypothetical protein